MQAAPARRVLRRCICRIRMRPRACARADLPESWTLATEKCDARTLGERKWEAFAAVEGHRASTNCSIEFAKQIVVGNGENNIEVLQCRVRIANRPRDRETTTSTLTVHLSKSNRYIHRKKILSYENQIIWFSRFITQIYHLYQNFRENFRLSILVHVYCENTCSVLQYTASRYNLRFNLIFTGRYWSKFLIVVPKRLYR